MDDEEAEFEEGRTSSKEHLFQFENFERVSRIRECGIDRVQD